MKINWWGVAYIGSWVLMVVGATLVVFAVAKAFYSNF
jgi:hypothetical protein